MNRPLPVPPRPPSQPRVRRRSPWFAMLSLVCVVAGAFGLGAAGHLAWQRYSRPAPKGLTELQRPEMPDLKASLARAISRGPSKVIYLNREGATLSAGSDDAVKNRSSIVSSAGLSTAQVPAFAGSPRRWEQIVRCVRSKFEPYDVQVVDQRPVEGSYVMAVVGGRPSLLGDHLPVATRRVTGLAPFSGESIRDAVVLVFSREMKENLRKVCETASMEIAHAYGLDHSRDCKDLMTYKAPCGSKRFVDKDIPCGEDENRPCKGGAPTQNSHARLLSLLGSRPAEPPKPPRRKAPKGRRHDHSISAAPLQVAEDGHLHQH